MRILITIKEMNRYNVIKKLIDKKIKEKDAKKMLNFKSVRQVRRLKKRVLEDGVSGVIHKGRGNPSNRRLPDAWVDEVISIIKNKYHDFGPTLASEKLEENHELKISKETLRKIMIKNDIWKAKERKKANNRHVWRPRKPSFGEMQQFDGSYHKWFEFRDGECCLLVAIDDATGRITHAKFDDHEGIVPVFNFWLEYFEKHGFPLSIYLDKFSTYKINHPAAQDNSGLLTQFQRAMKQVGVRTISAHTPQAKGRVERVNATLQDRLVKELRLANISTKEEGNEFLKTYIDKFNEKFAVVPENKSDLHNKNDKQFNKKIKQIFSIQDQRQVNNDYTVMFKTNFFQLDLVQPTTVFKKDKVIIETHLDGEIKINLNGFYLNYTILPERPKKVKNIPVTALTRTKPLEYKPPIGHPWKQQYEKKYKEKTKI